VDSSSIPVLSLRESSTHSALFRGQTQVQIRALLLGARITAERIDAWRKLADKPLVLAGRNGGCAMVFRYGAVVLFGIDPREEQLLCAALSVQQPLARAETETVELRIARVPAEPRIHEGAIYVPDDNVQRLQVIAEALAKSVVLADYESAIATVFDRIEPLALNLNDRVRPGKRERELLGHIGGALLAEQRMVGRVEVREKPEVLWENAELELFYPRLEREYELRDRAVAIERKLDLISRTAKTALELLEQRSNRRVEWYIVVLIVVEILLTVYSMLK
jgi:uncharacterized Rmd1/YagE family protein